MTRPSRAGTFATVFAVAFAVLYILAVWRNYALFTYHPALNEFGRGVQVPRGGPAMYWYGWLATAGLGAAAAGLAAALAPESLARRLWPGWSWVVPLAVMLLFVYMLRNYFA